MPIALRQNDALNALWTMLQSSSTGWCDRVEALVESALGSTTNLFGTAATLDVGTDAGDVPQLTTAAAPRPPCRR